MAPLVNLEELVEDWTLLDGERAQLVGKWGGTRLGFALLLKFFQRDGFFPSERTQFPPRSSTSSPPNWPCRPPTLTATSGRVEPTPTTEARSERFLGVRECSSDDAERLTAWLATEVACAERSSDRVRVALVARCRAEQVELPTPPRVGRIVRSALARADRHLTGQVVDMLPSPVRQRLDNLISDDPLIEDDSETTVLTRVKSSPGNVSVDSLLTEIAKLRLVRAIRVPPAAFGSVAPKVLHGWRTRAAVEAPSHLRRHPVELRLTLLAALVKLREREITDALVELLISTVHRINARADRKVTSALVTAFKKVTGKEHLLFSIAAAALNAPDDTVRAVVFPAVKGGEQTLRELVQEYKTTGPAYRRTVQTTLRASYTHHYRRGLVELLDVLEFRSNNDTHRPVLEALALVRRYRRSGVKFFPRAEQVPTHKGIVGDWSALVFDGDGPGCWVIRSIYEICTFQALREQLRCKEIWVVGANAWRNPDEDLPRDFEAHRAEHYGAPRQPLDPTDFIGALRSEMVEALEDLNATTQTTTLFAAMLTSGILTVCRRRG